MMRKITEYRCLLISPSDVHQERKALTDLVNNWNAQIGRALGVRVDLVCWESHSTPDMSAKPQEVLNKQLVDESDMGLAVFWSRLGTPTDTYVSGSVEEIDKLIERGVRVLIYLNTSPIPQEALKDDQYMRLQEAKKRFEKEGLIATYSDISQLKEMVQLHLTSVITEMLSKDSADLGTLPQPAVLTAPTPDIRVKVQPGIALDPWNRNTDLLIVTVQNYSPMTVYIGNVFLKPKGDNILLVMLDPLTRERQVRRKLNPGESFDFHYTKDSIANNVSPSDLLYAGVKDAVDRVYKSPEEEFRNAIKALFSKREI